MAAALVPPHTFTPLAMWQTNLLTRTAAGRAREMGARIQRRSALLLLCRSSTATATTASLLLRSSCRAFSAAATPTPPAAAANPSTPIPTVPFGSLPSPARSHTCAAAAALPLSPPDASSSSSSSPPSLSLCGWLQSSRTLGELWFGVVRDHTGSVQVTWDRASAHAAGEETATMYAALSKLPLESVVQVVGYLRPRPLGQANELQTSGNVELVLSSLNVLNVAATGLPISLEQEGGRGASISLPPVSAMVSAAAANAAAASAAASSASSSSSSPAPLNEELRLQHRYLDFRRPWVQQLLTLRSSITHAVRCYLLDAGGFLEVETPLLFKSTPEGADEFLVPTRTRGRFYALPQSPQQHKQLLMVGGVHRYFQIARCFRDEGQRADRQPEFTQIDLEMSFVTQADVMNTVEGMMQQVVERTVGKKQHTADASTSSTSSSASASSSTTPPPLSFPLPRMTYAEAMRNYGVDKPDTRYDLKLVDLTSLVKSTLAEGQVKCEVFEKAVAAREGSIQALRVPGLGATLSRKELDAFQKDLGKSVLVVRVKGTDLKTPSLFQPLFSHPTFSSTLSSQLSLQDGDLMLVVSTPSLPMTQAILGKARIQTAHQLVAKSRLSISARQLDMFWVTEFPLFDCVVPEPSSEGQEQAPLTLNTIGLTSMHHPFTAPVPEDAHKLHTLLSELHASFDPSIHESLRDVPLTPHQLDSIRSIRGQHYDLVCNGVELGGGSIRIHEATLQTQVLQLLGAPLHVLSHLLNALRCGAPPHGGLALGLDRVVGLLGAHVQEAWNELYVNRRNQAASSRKEQVDMPTSYGLSLPIREVIAFPKTTSGKDLMVEAPSAVPNSVLQQYHIQVLESEK